VSLDHAILGFLSERPRSGYDLKVRCFDESARVFWSADQAQVYRTLERLRTGGMITRTRRRSAGRPDRLVYDITSKGREMLEEWLSVAAHIPPPRDAFALQLYFSAGTSDGVLERVLAERRAQHQSRLNELREASDELAADSSLSARAMVVRQTAFDGAMARERSAIDWLDDCLAALRDGALPQAAHDVVEQHLSGA